MKLRRLGLVILSSLMLATACTAGDKKAQEEKKVEVVQEEKKEKQDIESLKKNPDFKEVKKPEEERGTVSREDIYALAKDRLDLIEAKESERLDDMVQMGELLYGVEIVYDRGKGEVRQDVYIGSTSLNVFDHGVRLISTLTKKNVND